MMKLQGLHCLFAVAAISLVGCGGTPEGTWAARLLDSETVWVAVTIEGSHAAAFVCGGADRLSISRWMAEAADDSMVFELDGVKLSLDVKDGLATGTLLDPDGVALNVNAPRIDGQGLAGLYTAFDSGARDGMILLPGASEELDALGAWRDAAGNVAQVTPVRPLDFVAAGIAVTVDAPTEVREFFMNPVAPVEVEQ